MSVVSNPVCYASRKFLPAERGWSTFAQEASTVVWALERFQEFTQGYHVVVECDHRNISFVKKSAMPQIARWRMRLQDMDFSIRYLAGASNVCRVITWPRRRRRHWSQLR